MRANLDALATLKLEVLATLEVGHPEGYSRALSRLKRAESDPLKGKEYKKVRHEYTLEFGSDIFPSVYLLALS